MARYTGPKTRISRIFGEPILGNGKYLGKNSNPPGQHGGNRRRKQPSEYALQLREKQKAKRYYGVLEKQFANYYDKASRQAGITGENLLTLLECRLDNVLVRLGFAASRRQSRQLIRHGHWTVNGRRVDIPSYQVREGDIISVKSGTTAEPVIRDATELTGQVPAWLQADHDTLTAKVLRKPERREVAAPVQEQLIVELYSK
jgi:small subunit ribosomal protein S4